MPKLAAIAGVAESDLGVVGKVTALQLQAQATLRAAADAGVRLSEIDGVFSAATDGWGPAVQISEYLGLTPTYTETTNLGGASFVAHLGHAALALGAGACSVGLIVYGSTQRSSRARSLGRTGPIPLTEQFERIWGLPLPVGGYALAAQRYFHEYNSGSMELAEVAVASREWARLNPVAFKREPITVEDVLASPLISSPLHLLDCCLVTDGGGAVIVVGPDRAADLPKSPVWLRGYGEDISHFTVSNMASLTSTAAVMSGRRALAQASVSLADIDVVELYDSFTITVLLTLEALGFCERGEAGDFVGGGRIRPGGDFPLNTNGGGLSYCHPGMFGIFTLIEATRQLRGECRERQVDGAELALVHGTGGVLSTAVTAILARE